MTKTKISIYTLILIILAPLCWICPEAYYDIKVISKLDWGIEGINGSAISQEVITVDEPNDSQAISTLEATIYAYTSSVSETDSEPCISASGVNLCNRYIAELVDGNTGEPTMTIPIYKGFGIIACPKEYEFEKDIIEINGVWLKCLDRMNQKLHPNDWDIYMGQGEEAYQRAMEWGVQKKTIKIITN